MKPSREQPTMNSARAVGNTDKTKMKKGIACAVPFLRLITVMILVISELLQIIRILNRSDVHGVGGYACV